MTPTMAIDPIAFVEAPAAETRWCIRLDEITCEESPSMPGRLARLLMAAWPPDACEPQRRDRRHHPGVKPFLPWIEDAAFSSTVIIGWVYSQ
jgi:hypothetical protein